jgi:hypothetical protein
MKLPLKMAIIKREKMEREKKIVGSVEKNGMLFCLYRS